jgi:hypothetical protein
MPDKFLIFRNGDLINVLNVPAFLFSILLIRLPIAFGYRYNIIFSGIGLIPIAFALFLNTFYFIKNKPRIKIDKRLFILFVMFSLIWIQAIIRTSFRAFNLESSFILQNLLIILTLAVYILILFHNPGQIYSQNDVLKAVVYAFGIYLLGNLLCYLFDINTHDHIYLQKYSSQMLGLLGIKTYRVLFPMADGINSFGILAGATLVGLFHLRRTPNTRYENAFVYISAFVCLLIMLLTDSRGALAFSIGSILLISLPNRLFHYFRWSPFIISILPLILVIFMPSILIRMTSWLNRPVSVSINQQTLISSSSCQEALRTSSGILSNRPIIWNTIITDLKQYEMTHLIGFGFRGQVVSSLSTNYSCLFSSYSNPIIASAHNIWLQLILDVGYLGVVVSVALFGYIVMNLSKLYLMTGNHVYRASLNILLFVILIGALEASVSIDFIELFILIVFISLSTIVATTDTSQNKVSPTRHNNSKILPGD